MGLQLNFAPLILFVYNRPVHTSKALQALARAEGAAQTELHIFADGIKDSASETEKKQVNEVRSVIRNASGFKHVVLHEQERNLGLAHSIINGVAEILASSQSVITLEDDVIVGAHILRFMNQALARYAADDRVFMVSGYGFNLPFGRLRTKAFFLPTGTTQAWGTWNRAWNKIDFAAAGYQQLKHSRRLRRRFNLYGGMNYTQMLIDQMETDDRQISSWAIRFRFSLLQHRGVTLFPPHNLIENIGWDGSGKHSGTRNPYRDDVSKIDQPVERFPGKVSVRPADWLLLVAFFYRIRLVEWFRSRFRGKFPIAPSGPRR